MSPLEITFIILLCTIIAFISGRIPFSIISTGIILALIFTGVMEPAAALSGFINTNVEMFVAMFVIGAGLTKTSLLDKAQSVVVRYKDNLPVLIFFSSLVSGFLGCVTSATATAAIMIPLLVGISAEIGVSRSKLLYPTMAIANIATSMTFHDTLEQQDTSSRLSPAKEKLAIAVIVLTIGAMLFENVIGIPMYLSACVGAAVLVLTGALSEQEALASIHRRRYFCSRACWLSLTRSVLPVPGMWWQTG